jgi:hypothetical protein
MIGDYLDGLDLSGIEAAPGGTAPQPWNGTYKNNRIVVAGFNTYKNAGGTEVTKNHIVFVTRNVIATGRMNATNITTGGYQATELRPWLDGAFTTGLKAALGGGNPLLTIRLVYNTGGESWSWVSAVVFLPSALGVFGAPGFGSVNSGDGLSNHLPIYQKGSQYRTKRWNGARYAYWLAIPSITSFGYFCNCDISGSNNHMLASSESGISLVFCVA